MKNTILIGTNNPSKLHFIRHCLEGLSLNCVSPAELGLQSIPEENARTARDNAVQKAISWHRMTHLPVITEDSGLVFLDLPADHPDQPGTRVRRPNGRALSDDEMLAWYSGIISRHGGSLRAAWEDAWCILQHEDQYFLHCDTPEKLQRHARMMLNTPCQTRLTGWPLDSLTYFPKLQKYKAELSIEEMGLAADVLNPQDHDELISWIKSSISSMIHNTQKPQD